LQENIEQERLHLAQELHDGPMQELYSAIYQIEALRSQLDTQQQEILENMRRDIQTVLEELRNTAKELRPPTLADFGLEKAIRSYIEDFQEKHTELKINTMLAQDRQLLPENVRLTMFRILQQSLANVVRHAEASQANVRFSMNAEEAVLEISDNGKGFEIPRNWMGLVRQGHFGLAGAAERIEALGGTLTVQSQPGNGTTVRVVVSLNEFFN
jgi:signal transduction histidine kinase